MKFPAGRVGWILLHVVLFGVVCAGMLPTFFWLEVPAVLIGLPVAIFAKSMRARSLAVAALMGYIVWIPVFLIFGK